MATLYTIGHSTRTIEDLIAALQAHEIGMLVDIRAYPVSRRLPHFNRENLEKSLAQGGIRYVWMKDLGGMRKKSLDDSPNVALRNASFRNYADYMLTPEFEHAISEMIDLAGQARTAYMCAERVYFKCHRMLVSDWLVANGHEVLHIDDGKPPKPHKVMADARLLDGKVIYRGDRLL
ncbi:MAG TPA: DUF488 domain-containing protein [Terriglobales bacterium]|jgi:uncharacterized protein (DUF488 family)